MLYDFSFRVRLNRDRVYGLLSMRFYGALWAMSALYEALSPHFLLFKHLSLQHSF